MTDTQPTMRKTRFVCVSDTHNAVPGGAFKLPKGDVLLHAGDMTNQGTYSELKKTVKWIEEADFEAKIVIAGNHDITLDPNFYSRHGKSFHNQDPQDPSKCHELLESSTSIIWLNHGSAVVNLQSPTGPRTSFTIFGSPYSPAKGTWAFGYGADEAIDIWKGIPADVDIIMTHTPPKHHCDMAKDNQPAGCPAFYDALSRIRPPLAICGHVHEGRGVEFVRWSTGASDAKCRQESTTKWEDPGMDNKQVSLVDLTIKWGGAVQNTSLLGHGSGKDASGSNSIAPMISSESLKRGDPKAKYKANPNRFPFQPSQSHESSSQRGLGRQETCIVNAAIMASSWPHGPGGKRFNKPIVVDIDLPMWGE